MRECLEARVDLDVSLLLLLLTARLDSERAEAGMEHTQLWHVAYHERRQVCIQHDEQQPCCAAAPDNPQAQAVAAVPCRWDSCTVAMARAVVAAVNAQRPPAAVPELQRQLVRVFGAAETEELQLKASQGTHCALLR